MPTGFTAPLIEKDGLTFQAFALACARAFGACIDMRDDPSDTPIPDTFQPSDYHVRALAEARLQVEELTSMSIPAQLNYGAGLKKQDLTSHQQGLKKAKEAYGRLFTMRKKVVEWHAPSPDHQGLKDFMLQQIDDTIKFDDYVAYYVEELAKAQQKHPMEYFAEAKQRALHSIKYHTKENQEEIALAAS